MFRQLLSLAVILVTLSLSNGFVTPSLMSPKSYRSLSRRSGNANNPQAERMSKSFSNRLNAIRSDSIIPFSKESISPTAPTERGMNIATALTLSRIAMIPAFIAAMVAQKQLIAVGVFVAASLTDWLDGYLARRLNLTSSFGAFLDPVADKLMMTVAYAFIIMKIPLTVVTLPVSLMLAREVGVSAIREFMASVNKRDFVKVGSMGKWKTALQMMSTTLLLYALSFDRQIHYIHTVSFLIGHIGLYLSAALSLASGWQYYKSAEPHLKKGAGGVNDS